MKKCKWFSSMRKVFFELTRGCLSLKQGIVFANGFLNHAPFHTLQLSPFAKKWYPFASFLSQNTSPWEKKDQFEASLLWNAAYNVSTQSPSLGRNTTSTLAKNIPLVGCGSCRNKSLWNQAAKKIPLHWAWNEWSRPTWRSRGSPTHPPRGGRRPQNQHLDPGGRPGWWAVLY